MHKPAFGVSAPLIALIPGVRSMVPTYERSVASVADSWNGAAAQRQGAAIDTPDWKSFTVDAELRRLVDMALGSNCSPRQTPLDIEAARAQCRIQCADRAPGLNAAAAGNRQRQPIDLSADNRPEMVSSYQVGLALPEYELDPSGRIKSLTGAALQRYLASEEAVRVARIALVAEVSQAYLSYDDTLRRLALTRQTLVSREYSFALIDQRHAAGTVAALDYQGALGLAEQARAEQERNLRQKQQALNVSVLLLDNDDAAQAIPRSPGWWPELLQDITPGTPSKLIERRLDILAARHRLRACNADIGATCAAFSPCISLTGSLGTSSMEMSGPFDGGSCLWSPLSTLTLSIFGGGRNRTNLNLAEACKDPAVAAYEGTIQTAFCEVADVLAASDTLCREEKVLRALANSSNEALKLAKARYESGADNHLRYPDAQRSSFLNEVAFIDGDTQWQITLVDPFRVLGGGRDEGRSLAVHRGGRS